MKLIPLVIFVSISVIFSACQKQQVKQQETVKKDSSKESVIMTREKQFNLATDEIIQQFKDGNERFLKHTTIQEDYLSQVEHTGTEGQFPKAIVLSCIDSRAPVEIVFDKGIGDIFGTRVAGNYADAGIIGGLEYACFVAGAKVIIVMGHSDCGAIKSACDHVMVGNITAVMDEIKPAVDSVKGFNEDRTSRNKEFVKEVTKKNVQLTIKKILSKSDILSEMEDEKKLKIIGAIYDVKSGKVEFIDHKE